MNAQEIAARLAAPFELSEVKFKPQAVSGSRALAVAYVDARVIQDRLDDVLGVDGWQDDYECRPDGTVVCRLRLRLDGAWVAKVDVGGPSEQPDGGDRMKAAFSDALKRAAVKFGVGRYLYRVPQQWVGYDPQKKTFTEQPRLGRGPAGATPAPAARPAAPPAPVQHDPSEIIGEAERSHLTKLLYAKKRTWQSAATWLNARCGFPVNGQPKDLSFELYGVLVQALQPANGQTVEARA